MIVAAHIKFGLHSNFLDSMLQVEDERLPGESVEDGAIRVYKKLEKAVEKLKSEIQVNGSDLPAHLKTEITFGPPPVINIQDEKLEIEIDNCGTFEELLQWKQLHDVLPGKIDAYYKKRLKELSV